MRLGMTGESVRQLQQQLAANGMYDGAVDGWYGFRTAKAVTALQHSLGVPSSGRYDQATQQAVAWDRVTFGGDTGANIVRVPRSVI